MNDTMTSQSEPALSPEHAYQRALQLTLHLAVSHHQAGRMPEAEQLYRAILQGEPEHPQANHNLGDTAAGAAAACSRSASFRSGPGGEARVGALLAELHRCAGAGRPDRACTADAGIRPTAWLGGRRGGSTGANSGGWLAGGGAVRRRTTAQLLGNTGRITNVLSKATAKQTTRKSGNAALQGCQALMLA